MYEQRVEEAEKKQQQQIEGWLGKTVLRQDFEGNIRQGKLTSRGEKARTSELPRWIAACGGSTASTKESSQKSNNAPPSNVVPMTLKAPPCVRIEVLVKCRHRVEAVSHRMKRSDHDLQEVAELDVQEEVL